MLLYTAVMQHFRLVLVFSVVAVSLVVVLVQFLDTPSDVTASATEEPTQLADRPPLVLDSDVAKANKNASPLKRPLGQPFERPDQSSALAEPSQRPTERHCFTASLNNEADEDYADFIDAQSDEYGNTIGEYEYLNNLSNTELEALAKQGYVKAMLRLAESLINAERHIEGGVEHEFGTNEENDKQYHASKDVEKGRHWAYQAALNDAPRGILLMSLSHFDEHRKHLSVNDAESAKQAQIRFISSLKLLEATAPVLGESMAHIKASMQMDESQNETLEREANQLIDDFQQQRQSQGFSKQFDEPESLITRTALQSDC